MRARSMAAGGTRRLAVAVGTLALLGGGLAACGGSKTGGAGAATSSKVMHYGIPASNVANGVTNPAAIQATDGPVLSIAYAALFHADPDGAIGPGLAVKWHYVGNAHKVFEFTLRKDARFSDGTPVTADAVVGWFDYYYKSKNVYSSLLGSHPKFSALDKHTVRVTLAAPLPNLPFLFSEANVNWGFVASPKAVANPKLFAKGTYGAGPYKLDYAQTVPGDHYTFVPNPYYYDKSAIKFKQMYVKAFADASSELQAQKAGQIDVGWTTDSSTAPAAAAAGLQVVAAPFAVDYISLNAKGPKTLADVRVRQALNYALDRKAIAHALFDKYGVATSEFTIPPDADPGMEDHYPYDPKKARSLLAAAGYSKGFPFTIDVGDPQQAKAAQLVAHYLDAIGVKTKVTTFASRAAYLKAALSFKDDAAIFAGDVGTPTTIEYPSYIGPTSTLGGGNPDNPKVDQLYRAGLTSSDPSKDWKPMWAITVTDAWFLPIAAWSDLVYTSKSVNGVNMTKGRPYAYPPEWSFK